MQYDPKRELERAIAHREQRPKYIQESATPDGAPGEPVDCQVFREGERYASVVRINREDGQLWGYGKSRHGIAIRVRIHS